MTYFTKPHLVPAAWIFLLIVSVSCFSQERTPGLAYWNLDRQIRQAFQKQDYASALQLLKQADGLLPNSPKTLFRMAIAEAYLHQDADAFRYLDLLVEMKTYFDLSSESAFGLLQDRARFDGITARMSQIKNASFFKATTHFRLDDSSFIPEGIAFDPQTKNFFVSSIRERKIVRVSNKGAVSQFIAPQQDNIWGISGIAIDSKRRLLWACSTPFEGVEGYDSSSPDKAALFAFNLDSGRLTARHPLTQPGTNHFCDGLVIGPNGTVYVADPFGLIVYKLDPDAASPSVLISPDEGISPQGLAISDSGDKLFISNYASGIYLMDLKTGRLSAVQSQPRQSLAGIDGLMAFGKDLIAIQNGIEPARVVRLYLNNSGSTVRSIETLEINHPLFGEPTLGVINAGSLFFVANNPITQYLKDRKLEGLPNPVILRRRLNQSAKTTSFPESRLRK